MTKFLSVLAALAMAAMIAFPAAAHHGWSWTEETWFELSGTVTEIYIGQPHATLTVEDADGNLWDVDLAPLSSTLNAGFSEDVVAVGDAVTLVGHRSLDPSEFAMKAVRVMLGDETYDVYPGRAADYDAETGNA